MFNYIYYRVFIAYRAKKDNTPQIYAVTMISFLQTANISTIIFVNDIISGKKLDISIYYGLLLFFFFILINYFRYIKNDKINSLERRWKNEIKRTRILRGSLVLFYIIASFLTFFISAYFAGKLNN